MIKIKNQLVDNPRDFILTPCNETQTEQAASSIAQSGFF